MAATFVAKGGTPFGDAEAVLRHTLVRARTAWPRLDVDGEAFVAHLARHVGGDHDPARALTDLHVEDLFLAFACAAGNDVAIGVLDTQFLSKAVAYARMVHRRSDGLIDEAAQKLRVKLLVREPDREPSIASFAGRSPLSAWLRVAAIREARSMLRRDAGPNEIGHTGTLEERLASHAGRTASPELALLKREGGESMGAALERALQSLDERDRALLRLYFVEGMSLATLGRIYHVHESTMARRVQVLRGRLLDDVKGELSIGTTSVSDLRALVESQLDMHLSEIFRRQS